MTKRYIRRKPKPCPWCGEASDVVEPHNGFAGVWCANEACPVVASVRVSECDLPTSCDATAVAIEIWNTRKG